MRNSFFTMWGVIAALSLTFQTVTAQTQPRSSLDDARASDQPLLSSSVDEIASEFDGARESFLNIDGRSAAPRIRRAVANMAARATDATEAGRRAINQSIAELESLAGAIEQRRLTSVRPLDEAFARANFALANSHMLLAIRAQNQQARQRIGEELNSAIGQFQQGTQRLGRTLRKDEQEFVQNTRQLAGNLIHGMSATTDEIGQGIRALGQRLEQVQASDSASHTAPPTTTGIVR